MHELIKLILFVEAVIVVMELIMLKLKSFPFVLCLFSLFLLSSTVGCKKSEFTQSQKRITPSPVTDPQVTNPGGIDEFGNPIIPVNPTDPTNPGLPSNPEAIPLNCQDHLRQAQGGVIVNLPVECKTFFQTTFGGFPFPVTPGVPNDIVIPGFPEYTIQPQPNNPIGIFPPVFPRQPIQPGLPILPGQPIGPAGPCTHQGGECNQGCDQSCIECVECVEICDPCDSCAVGPIRGIFQNLFRGPCQ